MHVLALLPTTTSDREASWTSPNVQPIALGMQAHGERRPSLLKRRRNRYRGNLMNRRHRWTIVALSFLGLATPLAAQADSLLVNRVQQEQNMTLPTRGMSMSQVEQRFGAPQRKLTPRGGDSAKHPVINRWDYANFIVYFERSHVIHAVLNTPAGNNTNPSAAQ